MHLDDQVVQRIDVKAVARRQNGRRTVFRDDRRAEKRIPRDQRLAIVYRRAMGFTVEEHRSMAGERLVSIAKDHWLSARIERWAAGNHTHANIHDFHFMLF